MSVIIDEKDPIVLSYEDLKNASALYITVIKKNGDTKKIAADLVNVKTLFIDVKKPKNFRETNKIKNLILTIIFTVFILTFYDYYNALNNFITKNEAIHLIDGRLTTLIVVLIILFLYRKDLK